MPDPFARPLFRIALLALLAAGPAAPARPGGGPTTLELPGGGTLIRSPIPGPQTVRSALGKVLGYATTRFGARPRLEHVLKSLDGTMLAAAFSVAPGAGGKELAGLAIVLLSPGGQAEGAILCDDAARFRSTFQHLSERAQAQPAAAPATALHPVAFPDGTGSMGLPEGWTLVSAHGGDVMAKGPQGEQLRFGLPISVIDPNRPEARTLGRGPGGRAPGNFVDIPFGTDAVTAYKAMARQLAQKQNRRPPDFDFAPAKELADAGGGRSAFLVGELDAHDGKGPEALWVQLCASAPMALGCWQMTLFQVTVPKPQAGAEAATVLKIFGGYRPNDAAIMRQIHAQMAATAAINKSTMDMIARTTDDSARSTQGMSDYLRGNTVVHDTLLNGHGRVSDDLADALVQGRPDRFEKVPLSDYVKGIDY